MKQVTIRPVTKYRRRWELLITDPDTDYLAVQGDYASPRAAADAAAELLQPEARWNKAEDHMINTDVRAYLPWAKTGGFAAGTAKTDGIHPVVATAVEHFGPSVFEGVDTSGQARLIEDVCVCCDADVTHHYVVYGAHKYCVSCFDNRLKENDSE